MKTTDTYSHAGDHLSEYETVDIKDGFGKPCKARKLYNDEARAKISQEYGFEYNSIKITGDCWYQATDWNYFKFHVHCWDYEVKDFGALQII